MNLLAGKLYDPAVAVSKATTGATAMAAFDTTNLRLAVVIPPSGNLYWKVKSTLHGATTYPQVLLGVMNGASVVARQGAMLGGGNLAATTICACWAEGLITGQTPGASVNLDAAWACETGVASTGIKYGGPNDTTVNNAFGGLAFEIYDPCPIYTPSAGAAPTSPISARVDTIDDFVDTEIADIQGRLPAALVGGRMDASVGAMAANTVTASALAADAGSEIGTAVWATAARTLTANPGLDDAGIRTAVGLASANLDTQLTAIDDFLDTEVAAIKAKTDNLPAAPAATGDCITAVGVRAAVGLASANLDTQIGTLLTSAGYTAPDNAGVAAIKAKTDSLTFTVAGKLDGNITAVNGITVTGSGTAGSPWGP